ncbi:hypothetical protein [Anaeromassilibacillus senegalensis]|uniref:hypothetical protein n=1 Tax=Anaeromassilibacillus senegalensis TaxID=1673717 RepID=UPI000681614A|nr:hypothetical protein [Anaeromassilibacillus senegalensis]
MIKTETIAIDGKQYDRTYSTISCYIERDGARYSEAIDPLSSGRMYKETDIPIENESNELTAYRTAYNIVTTGQEVAP